MKKLFLFLATASITYCQASNTPSNSYPSCIEAFSAKTTSPDTLCSYNIDGEHIKHFTGKELVGKTIKSYEILHTNASSDNLVIETHLIKTSTPSARGKLEPHYIIDGKEVSKKDLDKLSPTSIKSIDVLKAGSKAAISYGKDGDQRGFVIIKTKK